MAEVEVWPLVDVKKLRKDLAEATRAAESWKEECLRHREAIYKKHPIRVIQLEKRIGALEKLEQELEEMCDIAEDRCSGEPAIKTSALRALLEARGVPK